MRKAAPGWTWGLSGKHPAARDYIHLGTESPFAMAFFAWVEHGYALVTPAADALPCSWRFWARGGAPGELSCGVLRDSHDAIGRPFPCAVVGSGPLTDWERHWERLPAALNELWQRIEYLFARRSATLDELVRELSRLHPAACDWEISPGSGEPGKDPDGPPPDQFSFALDPGRPLESALAWHIRLRQRLQALPASVFLGGPPQQARLMAFTRALRPEDFQRLWSPAA